MNFGQQNKAPCLWFCSSILYFIKNGLQKSMVTSDLCMHFGNLVHAI